MIDIKSLSEQDAQALKSILKKDKNSITSTEWKILQSRKDYLTPEQLKAFFGKQGGEKVKADKKTEVEPVAINQTLDVNNLKDEHAK